MSTGMCKFHFPLVTIITIICNPEQLEPTPWTHFLKRLITERTNFVLGHYWAATQETKLHTDKKNFLQQNSVMGILAFSLQRLQNTY